MNIILLSGGSGKRLWPLSNEIRSKQFIKVFKDENGNPESMLQRMYRQIKKIDKDAVVTIATAKMQVSAINNQIGDKIDISIEPCRRDTFPAIALACEYLKDKEGVSLDDYVIVCPVDPYVDEAYFKALYELECVARNSHTNITLMGIKPTYPSEKYGYIIPKTKDQISDVLGFKEKPTKVIAEEYIAKGALWNAGVFAFKLRYLVDKAHELIDYLDYDDLYEKYDAVNRISFDYAVVEEEKYINVMRFDGEWKDLGTWNTLTEAMSEDRIGNVLMDDTCRGVSVINELEIPILCAGLHDLVVCAGPDGILVSDKGQSSYIKPYVDNIVQPIMYADKSWGTYKVIDVQDNSTTVHVTLNPGMNMNYHSHEHRDEVWTIVSGMGYTIVDGMRQNVKAGDVITIQAGCRHMIFATTELHVIEVQIGQEISVADKIKYELEGVLGKLE